MHKTLSIIALGIYGICGGLLLLFTLPQTGWKAKNVATGSMSPAISQGSLVLIHRVPPRSIHVGDVVTYINPQNTKQTITHRVVAYKDNGKIPGFVTKGDANSEADKPILGGNIVGRVEWHAAGLGNIVNWVHSWQGLIILVIVPGILIIIGELGLLVRRLSHVDNLPAPDASRAPPTHTGPRAKVKTKGIVHLTLALCLATVGFNSTQALLTGSAKLSNNSISVAAPTNHIVISRVNLASGAVCSTSSNDVSISNTGAGSNNSVSFNNNCTISSSNNTNVNVSNSSNQSASSGAASSTNNTSSGSSTSGNVSNSNSSTTNININNSSNANSGQSFILFNPTNSAISILGWAISDNAASQTLSNISVPAHGSVIITGSSLGGAIGNGLTGAGDRLILRNNASMVVDGLSWGSDNTVLNPAVSAIPSGGSAYRINPNFDTNTFNDWTVQP